MLPTFVLYKNIVINFYGLFIATGVLISLLLFYKTAKYRNINSRNIINFSILIIIIGLIGSRIFFILFNWQMFSERSWLNMVAFWRGGLMFQGGPIMAVLAAPFLLPKFGLKFWPTADVIAPSLAIGQGVGRIGCFLAGCCYGKETTVNNPISVIFPINSVAPANIPLWPSQLMESFCLLILSIFLLLLLKNSFFNKRSGIIFGFYLFLSGLFRSIIELFRDDNRGNHIFNLPPTTLISLIILIIGLIIILKISNKKIQFYV
jgi:phosphatidylglycerol:prolipoprotein diacylglycerol transferase